MSYEKIIADNKEWIDGVWAKLDAKMSKTAVKSRNKLPSTSVNGVHNDCSKTNIQNWTNGFWGGLMWLMYEATKNEDYKLTALKSEELMDECFKSVEELHHDVGFMWLFGETGSYPLLPKGWHLKSLLAPR